MSDTRTVRYRLAPPLAAYFAWLDADPTRTFDVAQYDLFVANYHADDPPLGVVAEGAEKTRHDNHRPPERRHDGSTLGGRLTELGY